MRDGNIRDYDQSTRLESEEGVLTTFYRIVMKKKGGGDVETAEVIMEDEEGEEIHAYRVEDEVFYPIHPEWIAEARDSDMSMAEIRRKHNARG